MAVSRPAAPVLRPPPARAGERRARGSRSTRCPNRFLAATAYEPKGRSLRHLKPIAYRTVDTCINTLGGQLGVGGRVDLWASEDGARASDDECARIAGGVEQWTTIERESLDQIVLAEPASGPSEPEPEMPEDLDSTSVTPGETK